MSKISGNFNRPTWIRQRVTERRLLEHSDAYFKALYSSILPFDSWDGEASGTHNSIHGGILCLEFSPDGSVLAAGCENDSIILFDSLSRKLIHTLHNEQQNSIYDIKFVDYRIFATGGKDGTIKLWDVRNLKTEMRSLRGHSISVKNVEFSLKNDLLVTSGCDGCVYTWNINSNGVEVACTKVYGSYDLVRMRLNPDASKMIISNARGYLIIVHDLDLHTLAQDLKALDPNAYRFTSSGQIITSATRDFLRLFSRKRKKNRVELVIDFPLGHSSSAISALEIHPLGWSALSRSTHSEGLEWTCVHAIRDQEAPPEPPASGPIDGGAAPPRRTDAASWQPQRGLGAQLADEDEGEGEGEEEEVEIAQRVYQHCPRLTHYIEERNSGEWFMKEPCFSSDGRLIVSPSFRGFRLLAFSPECTEQLTSCNGKPVPLHEIATYVSHNNIVLCTKVSPSHYLLVSGCLAGNIVWHQPFIS